MAVKVLHTADWHLGHTLHGRERRLEHHAFLAWLLDTLVAVRADALVIAGDVFETANPPATAVQDLTEFLAAARKALPKLEVVLIAGNHDSAARLDAMAPLLAFGLAQVRHNALAAVRELTFVRVVLAAAQVLPQAAVCEHADHLVCHGPPAHQTGCSIVRHCAHEIPRSQEVRGLQA